MDVSAYYLKKPLPAKLGAFESHARLELVELYVSDRCNLSCAHCFYGSVQSISEELSYPEWCYVIDQFVELGARHFHIGGREPFDSIKSLQVMTYLDDVKRRAENIKYGTITNGLAAMRYLSRIRDLNIDYLDFSLDGLQEGHELLRGRGTFKRTLHSVIQALRQLGREKIYVSSVIYKRNIAQIPEMIRQLCNIGTNKFFLQPLQPYGNGLKLMRFLVSPKEYGDLIQECVRVLRDLRTRCGIIVFVPRSLLLGVCESSEIAREAVANYLDGGGTTVECGNLLLKFRFEKVYPAFWGACIITADGYYIGSFEARSLHDYKDFSVGNVRDQSVEYLFEKSLEEGVSLYQAMSVKLNQLILSAKHQRR